MMTFRNCDRRWPFLWETPTQPDARSHADGEGPVQYLADTPDGARAKFLRHEEIEDEIDLMGVNRALWCIEADVDAAVEPDLPSPTMTGDETMYAICQSESRRLRADGVTALVAPSAPLQPHSAGGDRVEAGFRRGPPRQGWVFVLFGPRPDLVGWQVVDADRPPAELLSRVRPLS